jgi:hypothetical protein
MARYIPAKESNIVEKLENVIDWFDKKIDYNSRAKINESEV